MSNWYIFKIFYTLYNFSLQLKSYVISFIFTNEMEGLTKADLFLDLILMYIGFLFDLFFEFLIKCRLFRTNNKKIMDGFSQNFTCWYEIFFYACSENFESISQLIFLNLADYWIFRFCGHKLSNTDAFLLQLCDIRNSHTFKGFFFISF